MDLGAARRNARALVREASEMLAEFLIREQLAALGEVEQRGSSVHDLMVRRDVDFNIYSEELHLSKAADLARRLMTTPNMYGVQVNNMLVVEPPPGMPRGIYIGIKPLLRGARWTIDAWYLRRQDALDQVEFGANWWRAVGQSQKDTMLLLKAILNEKGVYGKEYLSAEIYRAVRDGGVTSIDDLERWHSSYVAH